MNQKCKRNTGSNAGLAAIICFVALGSALVVFSLPLLIIQMLLLAISLPLLLQKDYRVLRAYTLVFVVAVLFVFLIHLGYNVNYGTPYYAGGSDDYHFEVFAKILADAEVATPRGALDSGILGYMTDSSLYVVYLSYLVKFSEVYGSYDTLLPKLINVHFLLWVIMIMEYLLKKYAMFSEKKRIWFVLVFGLFPNTLYVNSHVFRDILNLLEILLALLALDKLLTKGRFFLNRCFWLLLFFGSLYCLFYTRINSLAFAAGLSILLLAERFRLKKSVLIFALVPTFLMTQLAASLRILKYIEYYSAYNAGVVGDGLSSFIFRQPVLPFGVFLRLGLAFISPFPNFLLLFREAGSWLQDIAMAVVYLGVVFQVLCLTFVIKRTVKMDWLALSFGLVFIAVISTTFTFRHVVFYYPFMAALGVDGFFLMPKLRRRNALALTGFTCFGLLVLYVALKSFL